VHGIFFSLQTWLLNQKNNNIAVVFFYNNFKPLHTTISLVSKSGKRNIFMTTGIPASACLHFSRATGVPKMNLSTMKEKLITRMGEVTEYRAAKWIEELNKVSQRSPKDQLLTRLEEASENLLLNWLKELDTRACWLEYREKHPDFCYGVDFGEYDECKPSAEHEGCTSLDYCRAEFEADWPEKKS
jgi:hypothetical protein